MGGPIYAAQDEAFFRADLTSSASGTIFGLALVLILGFEGWFFTTDHPDGGGGRHGLDGGRRGAGAGQHQRSGGRLHRRPPGHGRRLRHPRLGPLPRSCGSEAWSSRRRWKATFRETGPGITTAALTTAAGLAALGIAHFRLLHEVGLVLSIGRDHHPGDHRHGGGRPRRRVPARLGPPPPPAALAALRAAALRRHRRAGRRGAGACRSPSPPCSPWSPPGGLSRLELSHRPADAAAGRRAVGRGRAAAGARPSRWGSTPYSWSCAGAPSTRRSTAPPPARELLAARLGPKAEITSPADWLVRRRPPPAGAWRSCADSPWSGRRTTCGGSSIAAGFRLDPFAPPWSPARRSGGEPIRARRPLDQWPRWMSELVRVAPRRRRGRGPRRGSAGSGAGLDRSRRPR